MKLITSVLNIGGAEETVLPAGDLQEKENAGEQPSSPEKAELQERTGSVIDEAHHRDSRIGAPAMQP